MSGKRAKDERGKSEQEREMRGNARREDGPSTEPRSFMINEDCGPPMSDSVHTLGSSHSRVPAICQQ